MRSAAMQSLTNDIKARHPGVTIYGIGDDAHKTRYSDHNEDDTPGSKAAQSDPDNVPEHRAIDVMLGPALNKSQMQTIIDEILADQFDLSRLLYINFLNYQWSRSSGWTRHDNSDDPHPDHAHFSGYAPQDENGAGWLTGGTEVELRATRGMGQNGQPPSDNTKNLQRKMGFLIEGDPRLADHPLSVDGNYGGQTAYWVSVLLTGGDGNLVDGAWFANLDDMVARKRANQEIAAHLSNTEHGGGELPDSVEIAIPEQHITIPAQTVIAPIT
jgi:hypothetical protein